MILSILDDVAELLKIITNGVGNLVNFILILPNLFTKLVNLLPEPFKTIVLSFIGIIILLIVIFAVSKIVSVVKGG